MNADSSNPAHKKREREEGHPGDQRSQRIEGLSGRRAFNKNMARRYEGRATIPHSCNEGATDRAGLSAAQGNRIAQGRARPSLRQGSQQVEMIDHADSHQYDANKQTGKWHICKMYKVRQTQKKKAPVHIVRRIIFFSMAVVLLATLFVDHTGTADIEFVRAHTEGALESFSALKDQLKQQDIQGARQSANAIAQHAANIESTTNNPTWKLLVRFPNLNSDITCATQLAYATEELSEQVVGPFINAQDQQGDFDLLKEGPTLDLDLLIPAATALSASDSAVKEISARLDTLPAARSTQLSQTINEMQDCLSTLKASTAAAALYAPHLSSLLGGQSPHAYLLVIQDGTQARSLGGAAISVAVLKVSKGQLLLADFASVKSLGSLTQAVSATEEEKDLFGKDVTTDMSAMTAVPDYTRAAAMLSEAYSKLTGTSVDGVIMIDAVVLQRLMTFTGTVTLSDGSVVDKDNAASYLLHDIATSQPYAAQSSLFTSVAKEILQSALSKMDTMSVFDLASDFQRSMSEGRLLLWTSSQEDEAMLEQLDITASAATDSNQPELGVYVNDQTQGRIDWYLEATTSIGDAAIDQDGAIVYNVTTTLHNSLSEDEASELRDSSSGFSITGALAYKLSWAEMLTKLYFIAPEGGSISDLHISSDGEITSFSQQGETSYEGRSVAFGLAQIAGSDTLTLSYQVRCAADSQPLRLRSTPSCLTAS